MTRLGKLAAAAAAESDELDPRPVVAQMVQHFSANYIEALFGRPAAEWNAHKGEAMGELWELLELEGDQRRRDMLAAFAAEAKRVTAKHHEARATRRIGNRRTKRVPRRAERTLAPEAVVAVREVDTVLQRLWPHLDPQPARERARDIGLAVMPDAPVWPGSEREPRMVEVRLKTGPREAATWTIPVTVLLGQSEANDSGSGDREHARERLEISNSENPVKNIRSQEGASGRDG